MSTNEQIISNLFEQEKIDEIGQKYIRDIIEDLDKGLIRVAEKNKDQWIINEWVKKAILLYFKIQKMQTIEVGPLEFHDKIPLKGGFKKQQIRVVPHAIIR